MCSLLMLLATFLTVRAIGEQEQSGPQSILRSTRNGDCPNMFRAGIDVIVSMVQASYIAVSSIII